MMIIGPTFGANDPEPEADSPLKIEPMKVHMGHKIQEAKDPDPGAIFMVSRLTFALPCLL